MRYINYEELYLEIVTKLTELQSIVIATSSHNKPNAKTVNLVSSGMKIMFHTSNDSNTVKQIKLNPRIAIAIDALQIEAIAKIGKHPLERDSVDFLKLYKSKYPNYYKLYAQRDSQVVVYCEPSKISLTKLIEKTPCKDILDLDVKIAYRLTQ